MNVLRLCLSIAISSQTFIVVAQGQADSSRHEDHWLVVEQPASFPGGMGKFYEYISMKLKYPKNARRNRIQGKVYVEFVINKDGSVEPESVKAVTGTDFTRSGLADPECQAEAVRLVQGSPPWNPGMHKDKPVRQKMVLPIVFRLSP